MGEGNHPVGPTTSSPLLGPRHVRNRPYPSSRSAVAIEVQFPGQGSAKDRVFSSAERDFGRSWLGAERSGSPDARTSSVWNENAARSFLELAYGTLRSARRSPQGV